MCGRGRFSRGRRPSAHARPSHPDPGPTTPYPAAVRRPRPRRLTDRALHFVKYWNPDPVYEDTDRMSPSGAEVIRQIRSRVEEVDPSEVRSALNGNANGNGHGHGVVLLDVRESEEWDAGHIPGAKHVPRGYLESRIEGAVKDRDQRVVLYCASGQRSALAANTLREQLGYENVASMNGGITLWTDR